MSREPTPGSAGKRFTTAPSTPTTMAEMPAFLAAIWTRNLPLMRERLAVLDAAVEALGQGSFNAGHREQAIDVAHKFAGSLGTFGFPQGTKAARQLEHLLLESSAGSLPPDARVVSGLVASLHRTLDL